MQSIECNRLSIPLQILIVFLFCTLIGLFLSAINQGSPHEDLTANLGISYLIGFSIWSIDITIERQGWINNIPLRAMISIVTGALIGGTTGGLIFIGHQNHLKNFEDELFRILLLGLFFGALSLYIIYSQFSIYRRREQLADERRKMAQQELQLTQSRLDSLQSQIEPHFLFNTLANIHSRIESAPEEARAMMEHLTHILRFRLKTAQRAVSLAQELELVDDYLTIQKLRLGDRLNYAIQMESAVAEYAIPPLLIQPLVENAVTHGIEPKVTGGTISILVTVKTEQLTITVVDDGVGLGNSPRSGSGVALTNIRERLNTLYGEQAELTLTTDREGHTQSKITMPWMEEQS